MTTERMREVIQARPFRPFVIHLADGESLEVPHPDFIFVSPAGRTVVVIHGQGDEERMNITDLLLVTRLEVSPVTSATAGARGR